jgi:hypothetical protein
MYLVIDRYLAGDELLYLLHLLDHHVVDNDLIILLPLERANLRNVAIMQFLHVVAYLVQVLLEVQLVLLEVLLARMIMLVKVDLNAALQVLQLVLHFGFDLLPQDFFEVNGAIRVVLIVLVIFRVLLHMFDCAIIDLLEMFLRVVLSHSKHMCNFRCQLGRH